MLYRARPNGPGIQADIRFPGRFKGALTPGQFSRELTIGSPQTTFVRVQKAFIDETDHLVLNWFAGEAAAECQISREDGIIRYLRSSSKDIDSMTVQSGRCRSRDGVPFPAVSGQLSFLAGKLSAARLVTPRFIEVNKPIASDVFRVSARENSLIMEERNILVDEQGIAPDGQVRFERKLIDPPPVNDVVEYANSLRERAKGDANKE